MVLSRCEHPIVVTAANGEKRQVPCGKCIPCQSVKRYQWKKRLDNEFFFHRYGLAFTLTYDEENLPWLFINSKTGEYHYKRYDYPIENTPLPHDVLDDLCNYYNIAPDGYFHIPIFNRSDYSEFIQKIKNYVKEIRFYLQTELGPTSLRPHAHGVLFFDTVSPDTVKEYILSSWTKCDWSLPDNLKSIHLVENASYCTSYVSSTVRLPKLFQFGKFTPFNRKSTSTPIGSQIFDKFVFKDFQCQETESISFLNSRTLEYEFLPFLRYHEDLYFPKLPYNSLYSIRDREFLYKSYSFIKGMFTPKNFCGKFNFKLYEREFKRLLFVNENFREALSCFLTSESSIYRIYLTSKKFCTSWQGIHPLLRDYVFDRHFYNYEMKRLRLQYEYEEEFCNKRHLDARYLIYKDPVFVRDCENDFSQPSQKQLCIIRSFGFETWDEFTSSVDKFCLDNNPDVRNYLFKINDFSRSSHKSKAKNDYFENHLHEKPFYLKHGL